MQANHIMMEILDKGRDAILTNTHRIEDEWIILNNEPGLGFSFDEEKLKECAYDDYSGGFDWGRRRGGRTVSRWS